MAAEAGEIRRLVERSDRVLVLAHKDPDGDTLGSALAMTEVLRELGKTVATRVLGTMPSMYTFLPGAELINAEEDGLPYDLVVSMDASNLERLGDVLQGVPEGTLLVNIDHHVSNTRFGDINLVTPEASSTAEVTFDLLNDWGTEISPQVANNLYVGVLTDTGGFRHENTTERALEIAARLVHCGADAAGIAERVYKSHKLSTMKLTALVLGTMGFDCDDRLVHAQVSQELLAKAGAQMDETEGLIDMLQSVDGLELAILFKETGPNLTKISVRSRGNASANELAAAFGGGGHERAAGAEIELPLVEATKAVLAKARESLD
ncbi:MAG TPA: bifunctional oligoribonuclease/PAP phosphatase NrnA [Candidatus Dormibacteraeota bacterium]|jgi:phosphoesterase RecJ-like protein|nr:bifunctional oligoribonuclease/PAP phosphatase NrnA [Candidatus Dormibacteraeota bacterium]